MAPGDLELTIKISDAEPVATLITSCFALDELLARSYEPAAMSEQYKAFHDALAPFKSPVP